MLRNASIKMIDQFFNYPVGVRINGIFVKVDGAELDKDLGVNVLTLGQPAAQYALKNDDQRDA